MVLEDSGGMPGGRDDFSAPAEGPGALPEPMVGVSRDSPRVLELLKDLGSEVSEELIVLMPNLLTALRHQDPFVVKQSIASGTTLFGAVLEEIALQLRGAGKIQHWLEEMWSWMVQFKEAICGILLEPGTIGIKVVAIKFIEKCILYFTPDEDRGVCYTEGISRRFNVSHLASNYSILNPAILENEADRILDLLLDVLQLANTFHGSLVITVINALATVARSRPLRHKSILSALLSFDPNFESQKSSHASSIRYSLRTAFAGFLRCNHPSFIESKEKIMRALRAINPGESSDQVIRQVERMSRTIDRVSFDMRTSKGGPQNVQESLSGEQVRSKATRPSTETLSEEVLAKRPRYDKPFNSAHSAPVVSGSPDYNEGDGNGDYSSSTSVVGNDLSPAAKMIAMIGALLAEGERGAESLELLISNIHADLMADIVIETMKHYPKNLTVVSIQRDNTPLNEETSSSKISSQIVPATSTNISVSNSSLPSEIASSPVVANGVGISIPDMSSISNLPAEVKREPRRDPRRLDPRRSVALGNSHPASLNMENISDVQPGPAQLSTKPVVPEANKVDHASILFTSDPGVETSEKPDGQTTEKTQSTETLAVHDVMEVEQSLDAHILPNFNISSEQAVEEQQAVSTSSDTSDYGVVHHLPESDEFSSPDSSKFVAEDTCHDLITRIPLIELTDELKREIHRLAVTRIIEDYKHIEATGPAQACFPLLARLIAQTGVDGDILKFLQEHIVLGYHHHKGHELAMHVLYHLHAIVISELDDCSSSAASTYEKFLLEIAKGLLDSFPATDKSFSKLLGEAPILPDSSLKLLEDLCQSNCLELHLRETRDGDRVSQGLLAVWSLILGRPSYREACLDIALKCALHSQEEVRAIAIRLVANKLYLLNYAADTIEKFAVRMLLSVVEQQSSEADIMTGTSMGGSQISVPAAAANASNKDSQASLLNAPTLSLSQAQEKTSLFFALCSKKPALLQLVFDIYGRAPKTVKQSVHQHITTIVKNLDSSYSELLRLISNPPDGSKNLIVLVLETLTEKATPSADLIDAVKHLYETKLKDAAILIPMLSSFSKDEVLPIFPQLVDLPLEKFQAALACILQGSAHTGPALTPTEVLIAIHDINPQKDGVALKKITDACTACFEQRTVFTQQILEKSLSHLVEQVPLPLLFMRTVIQAIDAFPSLVDFVMGLLSKLVAKQIWKMPKLWVGFLKCASQTQPRSFHVLLQLPPPHLESALNRHPNLRIPLAAYANQPNMRTSLSWQTLKVLGHLDEAQQGPVSSIPTTLQASDTSSSFHGTALT